MIGLVGSMCNQHWSCLDSTGQYTNQRSRGVYTHVFGSNTVQDQKELLVLSVILGSPGTTEVTAHTGSGIR